MSVKSVAKKGESDSKRTCFVIMPISDMSTYDKGHFSRVYDHIIKPSAKNQGFEVIRADEVKKTNYIIIDILKKVIESDMVICDMSGHNPNVLYELGIRQAFNKPTLLLKDDKSDKIFDIQGLRFTEYQSSLRIDSVQSDISRISQALKETSEISKGEVNSLIQLLGVSSAEMPTSTEISKESNLLLNSMQDIASRITRIEASMTPNKKISSQPLQGIVTSDGRAFELGQYLHKGKRTLGEIVALYENAIVCREHDGTETIVDIDDLDDAEFYADGLPF